MINLYIDQRRNADVTILDLKGKLRVGGNAVALHRSIRSLILEKNTQIILNLAGVTLSIHAVWENWWPARFR